MSATEMPATEARQYVAMMSGLESEIRATEKAIARLDLDALEAGFSRQDELRRRISAIRLPKQSPLLSPELLAVVRKAEAEIAKLNRTQAALLRGARRSLRIWSNIVSFATSAAVEREE